MAASYLQRMGERIRERREELGMSRADVARAMPGKTNENAIYRWEKGNHRPQDDALEALATVLGVSGAAYFFSDNPVVGATGDLMGALKAGDTAQVAARLDEIATAVGKLLEAQETLAELGRADRALLHEIAQAVLPNLEAR